MQETPERIKVTVKERFAKVANSPGEKQPFQIGPGSAKSLGYDPGEIDALPIQATESFAGVGCPLALGEVTIGQTLLDLGCGAGLDCIVVARRIGPTGKVIGVDFSGEMLAKARENAKTVGVTNVEFREGEADALPIDDGSIDVVISNGVFNLCVDKPAVLAEAFRVLRPGGRIQMADILLEDGVPPEEVTAKGAWSA